MINLSFVWHPLLIRFNSKKSMEERNSWQSAIMQWAGFLLYWLSGAQISVGQGFWTMLRGQRCRTLFVNHPNEMTNKSLGCSSDHQNNSKSVLFGKSVNLCANLCCQRMLEKKFHKCWSVDQPCKLLIRWSTCQLANSSADQLNNMRGISVLSCEQICVVKGCWTMQRGQRCRAQCLLLWRLPMIISVCPYDQLLFPRSPKDVASVYSTC